MPLHVQSCRAALLQLRRQPRLCHHGGPLRLGGSDNYDRDTTESTASGDTMMTKLAYFEGRILPIAEANVSIRCNTLHYGTGCFGGLRAYWNKEHKQLYGFRLLDHYRRFLDSARLLLCKFQYTPEQLRD